MPGGWSDTAFTLVETVQRRRRAATGKVIVVPLADDEAASRARRAAAPVRLCRNARKRSVRLRKGAAMC